MSASGSANSTVLASLSMTRALTIQWLVVGLLGFVVSIGAFSGVYVAALGSNPTIVPRPVQVEWWNAGLDGLVVIALALVVVPIHEWVHGLAIRHYGGRPHYGVGLAYFVFPYAFATTEHAFDRDEFVVVALAPLVAISLVGSLLMIASGWGWLVLPLATNASGAVGDLWMAMTVLSYPSHVSIRDDATGLSIQGRPGDEPRPQSISTFVWDAIAATAGFLVVAALAVGLVGPFLLSALGISTMTIGRPGTVTLLFEYTETADGVTFGVGPGILVLGVVLGLCTAFLRSRRRIRRGGARVKAP